jgi:hypothetical protein
MAQARITVHHFTDNVAGTQLPAQLTEGQIGDARHGRKGQVVRQ